MKGGYNFLALAVDTVYKGAISSTLVTKGVRV